MIRTCFLVIVSCLSISSGCCRAMQPEYLCDATTASFRHIIPAEAESVNCVRLPGAEQIYVASWTTREKGAVASNIRLIDASGHSPRALQRIEVPDGFGTKLSTEDFGRSGKGSLVLLVTDFGAAATEVRVETYREGHLDEVFRAQGDSVQILHLDGERFQIAVHHHLNAIDIPDLYQMTNERIEKCDADYPGYYRQLLTTQHLSRDSPVAPSLAKWFARLLELSGDIEGAWQQRMRSFPSKP